MEATIVESSNQTQPERVVIICNQHRARGICGSPIHKLNGTESVAFVPLGFETSLRVPPNCSEIARARNNPNPIPLPGAFVVKNGSPARAKISDDMPRPWSLTQND